MTTSDDNHDDDTLNYVNTAWSGRQHCLYYQKVALEN